MLSLRPKNFTRPFLFLSFTLAHLALCENLYARETPWKVYGWPLPEKSLNEIILNQDALMGTYVCPALTRLNLKSGVSEPLLLSQVTEGNQGQTWTLSLKDNVKWANGEAVTLVDLQEFIQRELPALVQDIFQGSQAVPPFTAEKKDKNLTLSFEKAPAFGPYIFNRIAFHRIANSKTECAGSLVAREDGKNIVLDGSLKGRERQIIVSRDIPKNAEADAYLSFRFGNELHPPTWERQIEEELSCRLPLELPMMTMIAWNPEGRYTKLEEFRRAMTSILPRGALLRAGAGSLGDLISAPILRAHPGYKKSLLVMPYDLKKADAILNGMNLMRSEKDGYRRTPTGEVLEISIATDPSQNAGLLRKILDDSFRALGMRLKMVTEKAEADGILTGIQGNWPENDLAAILHSKRSQKVWPWRYNFAEIDTALDRYNLSLTKTKPDFAILQEIHELVMKREPFSVLVQHKSCMQYGKGVKPATEKPNVKNPDWIRAAFER